MRRNSQHWWSPYFQWLHCVNWGELPVILSMTADQTSLWDKVLELTQKAAVSGSNIMASCQLLSSIFHVVFSLVHLMFGFPDVFQVGLPTWIGRFMTFFQPFCPVGAVSKCFPNGYLQKWWDSSDGHGKGNHHQYNNYSDGDLKEYEIHCTVGRVRLRQKTLWPRGILILGGTQFRKSLVVPSCTGLTKGKRCKTSRTLLVLVIFPPSVQSISAASIQLSSLQAALVIYFVVDHVGWWKQVLW